MPRQARLDAPGTLHHVIGRGIERRAIFQTAADYEDFLSRFEAAVSWGGAATFAWALLPNHFHLLLRTGEARLPCVMRRILTGYAVAFNLRHQRHGHVFQNRYKSIVCEEETYLLELVRYIHLNPLRAGLVGSVEALAGFPYAGHSALMGAVERPWQAVGEVLGRFGARVERARPEYARFVEEGVAAGRRPDLVGGGLRRSCGAWLERSGRRRSAGEEEAPGYDERVLGSPGFVQELLVQTDGDRRQVLLKKPVSLAAVAEETAALTAVSERELRSAVKRPGAVAARRAFIQVAVRDLGYSGAAVARHLGVVASTVNRVANQDPTPLAKELAKAVTRRIA